jgi:hypothetical protein
VTFIPEPGEANYTEAKAYRPISLLPFMLKTMKTLVDRHIRDIYSILFCVHKMHFQVNCYSRNIGKCN